MEQMKVVREWKEEVFPVLQSKVEELQFLGYNHTTSQELWDCLMKKVWKGEPEKRLYEVVQDILHLSSHTYTSYLTTEAYQNDNLIASIRALKESE